YVHAKHDATKNARHSEADAYTAQIASIQHRAEMIRRAFLFALLALAGTLLACLLLGLGLYWKAAAVSAAVVFVLSMMSLLFCAAFYIREVNVALTSVQDEAHDLNFMDVGRI
ncbi:MAG: hypothetical protein DMG99_10605, partial [Acidobacteria bacterium]